jgi:hypothetical protein
MASSSCLKSYFEAAAGLRLMSSVSSLTLRYALAMRPRSLGSFASSIRVALASTKRSISARARAASSFTSRRSPAVECRPRTSRTGFMPFVRL